MILCLARQYHTSGAVLSIANTTIMPLPTYHTDADADTVKDENIQTQHFPEGFCPRSHACNHAVPPGSPDRLGRIWVRNGNTRN